MLDACRVAPCYPYDLTRSSLSFNSLHFISPSAANQHKPLHSSPPSSKYPLNSSVFRLIAVALDMLCPNFVSLMCIHASTQKVRALLDTGRDPDDQTDRVRICAVKGSVSVHIRLVCIAALFALVSGCIVCRAGARCAGSGVTSPTAMHP